MKKIILVFFLCFLLTSYGCIVKNYSNSTPSKVADQTIIETSDFDTAIKIRGPEIKNMKETGILSGDDYETYFLRGWKDKKTGIIRHQLYVEIEYNGDWRFYQSANFKDGKQYNVVKVDRKVRFCAKYSGCYFREIVGIPISNELLHDNLTTTLQIRVNAKSGHSNILSISPNYIMGYLTTFNR